MLEGKIEQIIEGDRREKGVILTIWIPCHNIQIKKSKKLELESNEEYQKRKSEWEHLHIGDVTINQVD